MLDQNVAEFEKMNLNKWHSYGYKGKGSTIVVLDTSHKPYDHTNVIDPLSNNSTGYGHKGQVAQVIREIAPEANIVVFSWFKAIKQDIVDWIKAHQKEISGINCSFAPSVGVDIFRQLKELDIPIIISSGNEYKDKVPPVINEDWNIAVGAWQESNDRRAAFSNYGEGLDVVAYTGIWIPINDGKEMFFTGTSCSAPVVSGLIGVYDGFLSDKGIPWLTRAEAKNMLTAHAVDKLEDGYDLVSGFGLATMPKDIPTVVKPEPTPIPEEDDSMFFTDTMGRYSEKAIDHVKEKGLMNGYPDGSFQPNKPVSREELAMVVARMTGFVEKK